MTETAPERIWATHSETWGAVELGQWADTVRHKGGEEYVHHSLLDEAVKALEMVTAQISPGDDRLDDTFADFTGEQTEQLFATLAKLRSKP
ncbi:hypothetical protein ACGYLO_16695 [Sulfitobacter sp. 1A13353]|uniref:hypothetical protein n=1 Tax=Sulfitobacter sp. 1A13353 TaxID=3368568 RepID=UPI003745CFB2